MYLLIDNFDSFTYNVVQLLAETGIHPRVVRNDRQELLDSGLHRELEAVVISPGPGGPESSGLCLKFLDLLDPAVPVLGICLGHQVLGHHIGLSVHRAERVMHGKNSWIHHIGEGIFQGLSQPFSATRYHSLLLSEPHEQAPVRVTSRSERGEIMGLGYTDRPWMGIQFHPESILTQEGDQLLGNFVLLAKDNQAGSGENNGT